VDAPALLSTMFASLRGSLRLGQNGAAGSRVLELEGVTAAIVPTTPDRSVINAVVYERPEALEAGLDELASAYSAAGVTAWTVWVPDGDERSVRLLEAGRPRARRLTAGDGVRARPSRLRTRPGARVEWRVGPA
jgi:hypothetical protein